MEENVVLNIIFKNGTNVLAEIQYADDFILSLRRPVEIIKRPVSVNGVTYEVITTSPFVLMSEEDSCPILISDILTKVHLHPDLYELYEKFAAKHYSNEYYETTSTTERGTVH